MNSSETETEAKTFDADVFLPKSCPSNQLVGAIEALLAEKK